MLSMHNMHNTHNTSFIETYRHICILCIFYILIQNMHKRTGLCWTLCIFISPTTTWVTKLKYRSNSLCAFLKQEKLNNDYDILHLKLEINEKQLLDDYNTLRFKFENVNESFIKHIENYILFKRGRGHSLFCYF